MRAVVLTCAAVLVALTLLGATPAGSHRVPKTRHLPKKGPNCEVCADKETPAQQEAHTGHARKAPVTYRVCAPELPGGYVAGCYDVNGKTYDYELKHVNLSRKLTDTIQFQSVDGKKYWVYFWTYVGVNLVDVPPPFADVDQSLKYLVVSPDNSNPVLHLHDKRPDIDFPGTKGRGDYHFLISPAELTKPELKKLQAPNKQGPPVVDADG